MKKYRCTVCEYIYDPEAGDPENGIPAGTAFEDLPEGWLCPFAARAKRFSSRSKSNLATDRP